MSVTIDPIHDPRFLGFDTPAEQINAFLVTSKIIINAAEFIKQGGNYTIPAALEYSAMSSITGPVDLDDEDDWAHQMSIRMVYVNHWVERTIHAFLAEECSCIRMSHTQCPTISEFFSNKTMTLHTKLLVLSQAAFSCAEHGMQYMPDLMA